MAKTILICNQKGGSGKSLIADELAFSFDRTGTAYSFYDLDSQGGVIHQTKEHPNPEVILVDTPGALQADLGQLMESADLVVIPTRVTARDIRPLQTMMDITKKRVSRPVLFILNGYNPRYKASIAFMEWFKSLGDLNVLTMPQAEAYAQASAYECSVLELVPKGSSVAEMTMALVNSIRRRIGLKEEHL